MTTEEELTALGKKRREADDRAKAALGVLKAAVLEALDQGMSQHEVSNLAGLDRMTVRKWNQRREARP